MLLGSFELKRRVIVAAAGMAIGIAAWYYGWTRHSGDVGAAPRVQAVPLLQLTGRAAGDLLREQAEYFDPTPLFFPTPQNFGQDRVIAGLGRKPSAGFADFGPSFRFTEKLGAYGLSADAAPQRPEDLLTFADEAPFAGMGRADFVVAPLPPRSAFVEVKSLMGGGLVYRQAITDVALPQAEFAPLEFLLLVSANGIVGEPLITTNSGSEQVDQFFRDYLVKSLRIGERLPPGKYAVCVGP